MSHLLISRRQGESFVVGGDVRITVVQVRGTAVRLRIEAPRETPVVRSELLEAKP